MGAGANRPLRNEQPEINNQATNQTGEKMTDKIEKWKSSTPRQFMTGHEGMFSDITRAAQSDYRDFQISAMLLISESNGLRECLNTPRGTVSLRNALARAASSGLSLNPALGEMAIIPRDEYIDRKKTGVKLATAQPMKNGMIRQAIESTRFSAITADLVRENDYFKIGKSIDGDSYTHEIAITDRGKVIGYYAAAKEVTGIVHVKYMTIEETTAHGQTYGGSDKPGSMWKKSFDGASIKTVLKALLRNLYLAPKTREMITADDLIEIGDWEAADALPVLAGTAAKDLTKKLEEKNNQDASADQNKDPESETDDKKTDDII